MTDRAFYGKYRGVVTNNVDPDGLGRIRAKVPDVLGSRESGWALPSVPYAGNQVGLFLVPESKTSVWIEFEQGDTDHPIWSGCFWGSRSEVPVSSQSADKKVLRTKAGTITLDDTQGATSITIETPGKLKIKMDQQGIEISNGSQKIVLSTASVSVNDGALEVT